MKYLFFLVLFANIVFFLWEIMNGTPQFDYPVRHERSSSLKEILLVSETQPQSELEPSGTDQRAKEYSELSETQQPGALRRIENKPQYGGQKAVYSEKKGHFCYEIGPFLNDEIQKKWLDDAQIRSDSIEVVNKAIEIQHGFVIFLPAEETYEKSEAYYEMLKQRGITDLWLFKKGESRGMISLGIYRNKQSGEKIQQQFIAQGLDVRIKPYFKTEQRYFVRITSKEEINQGLDLLIDTWSKDMPDLQFRKESLCAGPIVDRNSIPMVVG